MIEKGEKISDGVQMFHSGINGFTIEELFRWAVKNHCESCKLAISAGVYDYEAVSIIVDSKHGTIRIE